MVPKQEALDATIKLLPPVRICHARQPEQVNRGNSGLNDQRLTV